MPTRAGSVSWRHLRCCEDDAAFQSVDSGMLITVEIEPTWVVDDTGQADGNAYRVSFRPLPCWATTGGVEGRMSDITDQSADRVSTRELSQIPMGNSCKTHELGVCPAALRLFSTRGRRYSGAIIEPRCAQSGENGTQWFGRAI